LYRDNVAGQPILDAFTEAHGFLTETAWKV